MPDNNDTELATEPVVVPPPEDNPDLILPTEDGSPVNETKKAAKEREAAEAEEAAVRRDEAEQRLAEVEKARKDADDEIRATDDTVDWTQYPNN